MPDIETAMVTCGVCSMPTRVDFHGPSKGRVYKVCKCVLPNVNEDGTFDLAESPIESAGQSQPESSALGRPGHRS